MHAYRGGTPGFQRREMTYNILNITLFWNIKACLGAMPCVSSTGFPDLNPCWLGPKVSYISYSAVVVHVRVHQSRHTMPQLGWALRNFDINIHAAEIARTHNYMCMPEVLSVVQIYSNMKGLHSLCRSLLSYPVDSFKGQVCMYAENPANLTRTWRFGYLRFCFCPLLLEYGHWMRCPFTGPASPKSQTHSILLAVSQRFPNPRE